jgi:hypothetical protein
VAGSISVFGVRPALTDPLGRLYSSAFSRSTSPPTIVREGFVIPILIPSALTR